MPSTSSAGIFTIISLIAVLRVVRGSVWADPSQGPRERRGRGDGGHRRGRRERHELRLGGVVLEDLAGLELVDPAVERELAAGDAGAHGGVRAEVIDLREHVLLDRDGEARGALEV